MSVLLVAVAGALGALARVLVDAALTRRFAPRWPLGTAAVNVAGSLLLGLITGFGLRNGLSDPARLTLSVGFCGAFTTFSTASLEAVLLLEERRPALAVAYAVGGLLASVVAAGAGLAFTGLH